MMGSGLEVVYLRSVSQNIANAIVNLDQLQNKLCYMQDKVVAVIVIMCIYLVAVRSSKFNYLLLLVIFVYKIN